MTWIYLTDGVGRVRTNAEDVAAHLEKNGFRRCDRKEWAAVGRRLQRVWNRQKDTAKEGDSA